MGSLHHVLFEAEVFPKIIKESACYAKAIKYRYLYASYVEGLTT